MTDELRVERRGDALWMTMNRPDRRNAFNPRMIGAFEEALAAIPAGVRSAVLTGEGTAFCAGADLAWMASPDLDDAEATAGAERISRLFAALDALPIPLVARVNGPAAGGGVALAAIADVVLADPSATFQMAELLVGLVPAMALPYLARRIGPGRAREWALTAGRIDADRAAAWGLVGAVAPAGRLDDAVEEALERLRRTEPGALAAMKAFLRSVEGRAPADAAPEAIRTIAERRRSPEARARTAAFLRRSGRGAGRGGS
jgi:methylglutaconyl-CoA hydratase